MEDRTYDQAVLEPVEHLEQAYFELDEAKNNLWGESDRAEVKRLKNQIKDAKARIAQYKPLVDPATRKYLADYFNTSDGDRDISDVR